MQGDLTRETLADVIRTLYVGRRSGILHLSQDRVSKRIYFRRGSMIFANSDVDDDRLGEFLIRSGVIDREAFDEASQKMKQTGARFGRTLVALGYVTDEDIEQRVVEQIQAIIYSVFEWESGDYRFEPHDNPVDEDIVLNLSTADIILEGTRRMHAPEPIRAALGSHDRVPHPAEDPLLLYQKISTLTQSEYFVFTRIDGSSTISDIVSLSSMDEDETLRCIFGLLSAGVVELKGGAPRAEAPAPNTTPKPAAAPTPTPAPTPPPARAPAPSPSRAPAPPKAASAPKRPVQAPEPPPRPYGTDIPKPDLTPPEELAIRNEIIEKHASLSQSSLYDLLGVTISANDNEIKKAYYTMAKKYHPDRHHSPHLRDIHGLLEELFGKITQAYQVLSSTAERHRYDAKLRTDGIAAGGADTDERRKAEEASEAARKRAAEEQFKDAKRHYDEMHFFDAIQCLREAVRLFPTKKSHKLLAQALMKNPKWVKDAEEHFRAALKYDQFDADCYIGLGDIYESAGMSTRAQKMFERAATYDPDRADLAGKLHKRDDSSLGGIAKIFGRKKT